MSISRPSGEIYFVSGWCVAYQAFTNLIEMMMMMMMMTMMR